jgi:diguanylate cyclase (GGDEF)-like protein/PAS domain S-box-containing protein
MQRDMNAEYNVTTLGRRLAAISALLVAGIALLVLGTWLAGRWQMGTFGSDFIPMAPSTALLFLLLGAAVIIRARGVAGRAGRWFCLVAAGVALAGGALFSAQALFGFEWPLEQWLAPTDAMLKGIPVGRMSPMTAPAFMLVSGALLLQSSSLAGRAAARYLALFLTLAVLLAVGTVLISYGSGAPLLYGQGLVPMALPTAIAFMLLGASLLALSARETSPELQSPPRRMGWWALTIYVALAGAVTLAGEFYLRTQLDETRGKVEAELNAIADLKIQQIANWRRERLADAAIIGQAAFVARDVQAFLNDPSPAAKAELIHWLTLFIKSHGYSRVTLFDARGEPRLMLPDDEHHPNPTMRSQISDVLRDPRVQMTDLHRDDDSGDIHIDLAIPVFAPAPSTIDAQPSSPLAVILFELDPRQFLYPLIQTWPTPSRTAETVLVRRDGDDALYLNELRHRTNTALSLRVPLTRIEVPEARGALGQVGIHESVDYRGVQVLAAVRAVPDTPWFMVAKVDQEEIYAPLRQKTWVSGLVGMLFALAGGLGLMLLWRGRETEYLRLDVAQREQTEKVLSENEARFRTVFEQAAVGIAEIETATGRFIRVNQRYCDIVGYTREDMLALDFQSITHPDDLQADLDNIRRMVAGEIREFTMEKRYLREDGGIVWVNLTVSPTWSPGATPDRHIAIVEDITARKQAEAERDRLFNSSADMLCIAGEDGFYKLLNPAWENTLGWTVEELMARPWVEFVHQDDRAASLQAKATIEGNQPVLNFENRYHHRDGTYRWLQWKATPVPDGDRVFAIARDITERKQAEEALRHEKNLAQQYLNIAGVMIVVIGADQNTVLVNRKACQVIGLAEPDLVGKNWFDTVLPEKGRDRIKEGFADLLAGKVEPWEYVEHPLLTARGEERLIAWHNTCLKDEHGIIVASLSSGEDITERKRAEEELKLAALVYQHSSEAMLVADADNHIIAINPAFTALTGYTAEDVIGKNPNILRSGRETQAFYQAMWHAINTTGQWQGEIWNQRKNGNVYVGLLTINTIFNKNGTVHRRVALFSDITQRKENEELIWKQANFDPLTGLPNRRMFHDRLQQEILKAHRAHLPLALMFLDIDRFKEINDTLGHSVGDLLLKEVAQRLKYCVRESDTVARLSGDEFIIILNELDNLDSLDRVAQAILQKLAEPYRLENNEIYVSASIGITLYPDDASEIDALLKNADQAMYAAKNAGRSRYSYFTPSMQELALLRMHLSNELRSALPNDQLLVYYQPIVDLASGVITKAEALIRWQHPTRGLVSPAQFIPIAEDTGLIVEIGNWVFHQAVDQVARWRSKYHAEFQISINKSPVQFHKDTDSCHHASWLDYLEQLGLSGQSIVVEITEGLLLDTSQTVIEQLLSFRDANIRVSLDDFGTGYSSLSYLKKFDIDYLKIDQSFIRNLTLGSDDMALCEAIIVMAHKLGIKVIAEGVETVEQRDLLIAANCDYGQGYLFSRPVPAREFEKLLQVR